MDTYDTDIDTYVIDPTGDYSCYYHKVTADGGELDYDCTTGYGPEHWTLMDTDTLSLDSPYYVRLHYYSDHGNSPSNYTVNVKLNEGTDLESNYTFRGNLAYSDSSNTGPNATGWDWADVCYITFYSQSSVPLSMQPLVKTKSGIPFEVKFGTPPKDKINIKTSVPPAVDLKKRITLIFMK